MELNYAPPERSFNGPRIVTIVVLAVGLVLYRVLCDPAIHRRGYPPIDAWWMGMTWLWIFPAALTSLVEPKKLSRFFILASYAFATAWVDARTRGMDVPRYYDPSEVAWFTVLFYGPIHLLVVVIVEFASQFAIRLTGCSVLIVGDGGWRMHATQKTWLAASIVIILAIATPWAYDGCERARLHWQGIRQADADWANGKSFIYESFGGEPQSVDARISVIAQYDRATGLRIKHERSSGFEAAYNEETLRLVAARGKPSWAFSGPFVTPDRVAAVFLHGKLPVVAGLPLNPTPDITVSYTDGLLVSSRFDNMQDMMPLSAPVYCGRVPELPGIVFIKHGRGLMWMMWVMTEDGHLLSWASSYNIPL
jgi:hypothetical protein